MSCTVRWEATEALHPFFLVYLKGTTAKSYYENTVLFLNRPRLRPHLEDCRERGPITWKIVTKESALRQPERIYKLTNPEK